MSWSNLPSPTSLGTGHFCGDVHELVVLGIKVSDVVLVCEYKMLLW